MVFVDSQDLEIVVLINICFLIQRVKRQTSLLWRRSVLLLTTLPSPLSLAFCLGTHEYRVTTLANLARLTLKWCVPSRRKVSFVCHSSVRSFRCISQTESALNFNCFCLYLDIFTSNSASYLLPSSHVQAIFCIDEDLVGVECGHDAEDKWIPQKNLWRRCILWTYPVESR